MLPIGLLALISALIAVILPPTNLFVIMAFIILVSLMFGLAVKLFTSHKYAFVTSALAFVTLTILALDLFDPINITLAISLIVGISILIK